MRSCWSADIADSATACSRVMQLVPLGRYLFDSYSYLVDSYHTVADSKPAMGSDVHVSGQQPRSRRTKTNWPR